MDKLVQTVLELKTFITREGNVGLKNRHNLKVSVCFIQ